MWPDRGQEKMVLTTFSSVFFWISECLFDRTRLRSGWLSRVSNFPQILQVFFRALGDPSLSWPVNSIM